MRAAVLFSLVAAACVAPAAAFCQDVAVPRDVVVMIFSNDQIGSGFIVGRRGQQVSIVTARHVIDPKGPASDATGWHDCPGTVQVAFYPNAAARYPAEKALCNRDPYLDLAVVQLNAPENVSALQPFAVGTPAAASDNFNVTVIGHPDGAPWVISAGNRVTKYDPAVDPRNFTFTRENVRPGFSGGPVIADGLVGMAVSTSEGVGIGLQWSRIATDLKSLNVPTDLLKGAVTSDVTFDPPLAATLPDDAVRNALRQYVYAFNNLRRAEILNVYPGVDQADLDALLGDTSKMALQLANCTRMDAGTTNPRATAATYSCGYSLTLTRRTGPPPPKPEAKSKMTFELVRGPTSWLIQIIK